MTARPAAPGGTLGSDPGGGRRAGPGRSAVTGIAAARAAKQRLADRLRDHPAVTGVGLAPAAEGYAVKVNLRAEDAAVRRDLPAELDGAPVVVEVVGPARLEVAPPA